MKKSTAVPVTLLAVAAFMSLNGCEKPKQVQRCIDANENVVTDDKCEDRPAGQVVGIHGYPYYRWYYGGHGYVVGDPARDGSFAAAPNVPVVRASSPEGVSVIRGGFGGGFFGAGE